MGPKVPLSNFRLNVSGFNAFRTSPEVRALLAAGGHRVAEAAGGEADFPVTVTQNKSRVRVIVSTGTQAAKRAEAKHRALTRAIDAGRI